MKMLAEVAFEAKKPLEIVAVDLESTIEIAPLFAPGMGMNEINIAFDVMPAGRSIRSGAVY